MINIPKDKFHYKVFGVRINFLSTYPSKSKKVSFIVIDLQIKTRFPDECRNLADFILFKY